LTLDDPLAHRDVGIAWSTDQAMLPSAQLFLEHAVRHTEEVPQGGG
jgi:hypothetical protein